MPAVVRAVITTYRPSVSVGETSAFAWIHEGGDDGAMSIIKINAITVAADSGDELAQRFAARAGAVDDQDGFEGFELLKPTDERTTWLVVTRWRDEDAFQAWVSSPAFGHGHRSEGEAQASGQRPAGVSSELWSYEPAGGSTGAGGAS
jgi:heme-degrading monooxygenase HmoA